VTVLTFPVIGPANGRTLTKFLLREDELSTPSRPSFFPFPLENVLCSIYKDAELSVTPFSSREQKAYPKGKFWGFSILTRSRFKEALFFPDKPKPFFLPPLFFSQQAALRRLFSRCCCFTDVTASQAILFPLGLPFFFS